MATSATSWAVHCGRCEAQLAAHDHLEFFQQNNRAIHLGLRRHNFDEVQANEHATERTLRSKTHPHHVSFTKIPQSNLTKRKLLPFRLHCPGCQIKIGSEVVLDWTTKEYLLDSKACRVSIHMDGVAERIAFKKYSQLLRMLQARKAQPLVRSPTSAGDRDNEHNSFETSPKTSVAPMVWPTADTIREQFCHTSNESTLSTLRDYQMELVIGALLDNTIIYLPTGCGKTLVAVRVISFFKHLNPKRKAVFLVPTGPLVGQQAAYLRRESTLNVLELSGQHVAVSNSTKRRQKLAHADALVATPQYLENMLSNGEFLLEQVCVLVFDEAHHATGEHPYSDLLKRIALLEMDCRPRIVALTASPFGQRVSPLSVMKNNALRALCVVYNAQLDTPTIVGSLRELSSVFKKVDFITSGQGTHEKQLYQGLCQHLREMRTVLCSLTDDGSMVHLTDSIASHDTGNDNDNIDEIYILCGKIRKLQDRLCGGNLLDENYRSDIYCVLVHMRRILMVLPRMAIHSARHLAEELRDYFARLRVMDPLLHELLRPLHDNHFGPMHESLHLSPPTGIWQDEVSWKVQAVARVVENSHFDRNSRAIVFVRRRKTAIWLAEVMEKVPVLRRLNPTRFIGHNSFEGMTWEQEQRPTLERFRQGRIRMLVATSVLEEGLDVPECSLVIQFDGVIGMTSLVQSRGRARQSTGQFVVICDEAKKLKLEAMIQSEVGMLEMVRAEADTLESKATTRKLMRVLSGSDVYASNGESRAATQQLPDQDTIDWSAMDTKLCISVGLMAPDLEKQKHDDLRAIIQAINRSGCVNVRQADQKLGLVAVEVSSSSKHRGSWYHKLCQRLSFRITERDGNEIPYWIKMAMAPTSTPTESVIDNAAVVDGLVFEEPDKAWIRCGSMYRGWFVQQNAFIASEEYTFVKAHLAKQANLLVMEDGENQRYDFDLLSLHNRTVWVETTSATDWVMFMTFRHAPKIWWIKNSLRECRNFHMEPLTFAFEIRSNGTFGMQHLRQLFIDGGVEVRDTKIDLVDSSISRDTSSQEASSHEPFTESTMVSYARMSLVSTWCFALGDHLPARIVEMVQKLENDKLRVEAMLRFEHSSITEEELVTEFRSYINENYPALRGLAKLQQQLVLKAIVTPTRILFERPDIAPPNRVFRHFDPKHFLYVYFCDENRERLDFSDDSLAGRVREVMLDGIHIGEAHFKFLGCSLSQLRSASCIFTVLDPDQVRQWIGDLHCIMSPAKYLKRLGQAFSSTRESIAIDPNVLKYPEGDIKDRNGHYTFTDGCGEITELAASSVAHMLRITPLPSAFQIRLGGAKGVLVVSDFVPPEYEDEDDMRDYSANENESGDRGVRLRESMVKFTSRHNKLEIVAYAGAHSVAYLNRQSILILSDLGIDDIVFLNLQDEFMLSLSAMIVSDKLGLREVRASVPPDQVWWMDVLYNILSGEELEIDPYHRRIIHAIYQYKLTNTVLRARIPVVKGRTLMGVADFTGTLMYGEVFVQYTERDVTTNDNLERLVALNDVDVLVHRSPCHHPGDLRVLRCRNIHSVPDALRQLRDCIVFPTCGPRPHPDECTGGDLDGDVYTVIWDERLIPPRGNIVDAMTPFGDLATPKEDRQQVDVPQLIEFYLFALRHDILGMASHAHMAVSDIADDGCFASDALLLADICSREVDCCKNPAFLKLVQKVTPHQYPDFLQNTTKASYKSIKVLGRMYRRALALSTRAAPSVNGPSISEVGESYLVDGYLKYTSVARVLYQQYKLAIRMIMQSCSAVSEAELATGMIIETKSEYKADYFRFGERSRDVFYNTQGSFRGVFDKAYGAKPECVRRRVAAAWYAVAYGDPSEDRLLSFPWILADLLIKNRNINSTRGLKRTVVDTSGHESVISAALEHVTNRLQLSLLNQIDECRGALLTAYHERLQAVTSLRLALGPHFDDQDVGCVLFGSSALLTFEAQSDLDVVLLPVTTPLQLRTVGEFAESTESITHVQLRERTLVPVLVLSLDERWSVEISSGHNGPTKTAWFRAYMVKYPFFWTAVFFLIKWGKAAGVIRRRCLDGTVGSTFLPVGFLWLFIDFCVKHEFVDRLQCPDNGLDATDTEREMDFWSTLLQQALDSSLDISAARVILAFFRYFGDLATPQSAFGFQDPLDPHNNTSLTAAHSELFRQQCYIAHHQLVVSNGDIVSLLQHQQDNRRRITLSRALSSHVHQSPKFFASKILGEAGVFHTEAKLVFTHHPNALRADLYVADIMGDGEYVHRIEQRIEKIEEQLGTPLLHKPTENVHHSGCCLLLFEGATEQSSKVAFRHYFDSRHAQHEALELHQAQLVTFPNGGQWLEHAIGTFTTKFMRQMVKLTHFEKLNPGVARAKAIVRFGCHYLINLPWSFNEESISLATIEMLEREFERGREARELYESVLVAREREKNGQRRDDKNDNDEDDWQPTTNGTGRATQDTMRDGGGSGQGTEEAGKNDYNSEKGGMKPLVALEKASAMTARDRGVAHSFYSMIVPQAAPLLDTFAIKYKSMHAVGQTESYQVSIVRDAYEFNVHLTPELQLIKVKTRPSRWLSATLKMRQELVDDQSRIDATPDIRLYVTTSESVPSSDPLPQLLAGACAKANDRCGVLRFRSRGADNDGVRRVCIATELLAQGIELKEIVNVRHVRCTTYEKSPTDGVLLRVLKVVEWALPKPDGFVNETHKTECEIVMPALTAAVRVDAAFARRFVLAGVELVEFLRRETEDI